MRPDEAVSRSRAEPGTLPADVALLREGSMARQHTLRCVLFVDCSSLKFCFVCWKLLVSYDGVREAGERFHHHVRLVLTSVSVCVSAEEVPGSRQ